VHELAALVDDRRHDRSFTVSVWAYLNDKSVSRTVVAQEGRSESGVYLKVDHPAGDKWSVVMPAADDPAGTVAAATSTAGAALNTWTHLTGVFDGAARQLRLYVNGQLATTKTLDAAHLPWTAAGPLEIGRSRWRFPDRGRRRSGLVGVRAGADHRRRDQAEALWLAACFEASRWLRDG
jgi:hypothetical protein